MLSLSCFRCIRFEEYCRHQLGYSSFAAWWLIDTCTQCVWVAVVCSCLKLKLKTWSCVCETFVMRNDLKVHAIIGALVSPPRFSHTLRSLSPTPCRRTQRTAAAHWATLTQVAAARGIACERTTAAAAAAAVEHTSSGGSSRTATGGASSPTGGLATAAAAAAALALGGLCAGGEQEGNHRVARCEAADPKPASGGAGGAGAASPMRREDSGVRTAMPGVNREDSRSAMWPNRDRPSETRTHAAFLKSIYNVFEMAS